MATTLAIVGAIAGIAGTGASVYADVEQKKAVEEQTTAREQAEEEARLASIEQAPLTESAKVKFGTTDPDDEIGSLSDFLYKPKENSALGGSATSSGLGFYV